MYISMNAYMYMYTSIMNISMYTSMYIGMNVYKYVCI